jgi:phosphate transport system substrate-binding protein
MKRTLVCLPTLFAILLVGGCSSSTSREGKVSADAVKLQGVGASFPALLYNKWFKEFNKSSGGKITVDYQSQGSGAGIKAVKDGTADFGASDAAMDKDEREKVARGVVCLPMTAGSISLAYNLDGVESLKLPREAYTDIFLGKIKKWNDPAIAKANPGVTLPDAPITVIVRQDSSGTSYVFTKHLSTINKTFGDTIGANKDPKWDNAFIKAKGNEGIASQLRQSKNSIGYIETTYLLTAKNLKQAELENKDGNYVLASSETARKGLATAELPADLIAWAPDPSGKDSYPIVSYTWLLCYKTYDDAKKLDAFKQVLKYCLTDGQKMSESMGYVALPEAVVTAVNKAIDEFTLQKKAATPSLSSVAAQ